MSKGSGRRRHRVTLQAPVETQGSTGAMVTTYPYDTATVWAEVLELIGREYMASRELHSKLTTAINIRYRSDVTGRWRAVHGSRIYDIKRAVDTKGRRFELDLLCVEIL